MIYYEPGFFSEQVGMRFLRLWFFSFRDGLHWFSSRFGELGSAWRLLLVRNLCSATLNTGLGLYVTACFLKLFAVPEPSLPVGAVLLWFPLFLLPYFQKKRLDRAILEVVKNPSLGFAEAFSRADMRNLQVEENPGISEPLARLFTFFGGKDQKVLQQLQPQWTELQERLREKGSRAGLWSGLLALQSFFLLGGFQAEGPASMSAAAALMASLVSATFRLVYRGGGEWYLRRLVFLGAQNPQAVENSVRDFHAFHRVQQWPVAGILREDWLIGLGFFLWWLPFCFLLGMFFPGLPRFVALIGCLLLPFLHFFIQDSRLFHSLRAVSDRANSGVPFFVFGWLGWGFSGLFGLDFCFQVLGAGVFPLSEEALPILEMLQKGKNLGLFLLFLICLGLFSLPGVHETLGRGRKLGVGLLLTLAGFSFVTSILQLIWLAPLTPVLELTAAVLGFRMKEKG